MSSNQAQDESEGAESHAPASVQQVVSSSSRRLMFEGREEAQAAFFDMMDKWFGDYLRNYLNIPRPPPLANLMRMCHEVWHW